MRVCVRESVCVCVCECACVCARVYRCVSGSVEDARTRAHTHILFFSLTNSFSYLKQALRAAQEREKLTEEEKEKENALDRLREQAALKKRLQTEAQEETRILYQQDSVCGVCV